jgi:aspartyl protease family protein
MSDNPSPWAQPDPPPGRDGRRRLIVGLVVALAAAGGVWALSRWFPGELGAGADWNRVAQPVAILALVSASLFSRRLKLKQTAQYVSIWFAIAAVLLLGYSYRDDAAEAFTRVRSELLPAYAMGAGPGRMVLTQGDDGGFSVMGQVNGQPVRFAVDTGASDIVLSPDDARRLGVAPATLHFTRVYETANGVGHGAPFTAGSLTVGAMTLANVKMTVNQAPMETSLLGMAFLKRLRSFEVRDRRLYLDWRG